MSEKKTNVKMIFLIFIFVIIVASLIFCVIFSIININNTNILNGISIEGIDLSGKSKEEAIDILNKAIEEKMSNNIKIVSNDYETELNLQNIEATYDVKKYVNQALQIGRTGNIVKNNFEILDLMLNKKNIEIEVTLNQDKLNGIIDEISANLPNKLVQSSYYIEGNNLIITKGTAGDIIVKEDFVKQVYELLNDITLKDVQITLNLQNVEPNAIDIDKIYNEVHKEAQNAYYQKQPFKVYTEVKGTTFDKEKAKEILQNEQDEYTIELTYTEPQIKLSDLNVDIFRDKLSHYTTKYNMANMDRSTNLELAAEKIDGTILAPGEEFSYNKVVGARTIETGYKEAKIYSNGQVVDGIGGGICQISSTLYNSVVMANLDVTQRYNHQFVTSYVPAGQDATVVYGVKDFKFVNSRSYPVKIEMKVSNGIVSCDILRNKRGG